VRLDQLEAAGIKAWHPPHAWIGERRVLHKAQRTSSYQTRPKKSTPDMRLWKASASTSWCCLRTSKPPGITCRPRSGGDRQLFKGVLDRMAEDKTKILSGNAKRLLTM
jgi:hypothetical protein